MLIVSPPWPPQVPNGTSSHMHSYVNMHIHSLKVIRTYLVTMVYVYTAVLHINKILPANIIKAHRNGRCT